METIHDRCIAVYDESNDELELPEFLYVNDAKRDRASNDT